MKRIETTRALEIAKRLEQEKTGVSSEAAQAIRGLVRQRDILDKMDREAATHVESVIAMRTGFTGEPPYVGWKGLGLALSEALDELDRLRSGHNP